jgi:4-amino-4-deoxy-L-arabinose transferase-like glycosyltransferase
MPAKPVWREIELLLIVLVVGAIYFPRLTSLTIRGEESRWARVAQEMIESGDWIVPRQQGSPFPDRPPLNSWAMIGVSKITGELNLAAVRLPSALATLLTSLVIYLYGRNFLSRVGALAGALAYPTMSQVLQLGRLAESDSLLTLCVTAALFSWHFGYACRRDPRLAWCAGYAAAALAGLAKGPQGPVYFIAATVAYLCVERDWRFLFSRWHLAGCMLFLAMIGTWQMPFYLSLDSANAQAVWSEGGDLAKRFQYSSVSRTLRHWGAYPFEVFACTFPWSFLLPALATRWLRRNVGAARPLFVFLLTACAVALPTCWLPADSRPRYFMSLYPCIAVLTGLIIERSWESQKIGWWQRSWDRFLKCAVCVTVVVALGVPTIRLLNIKGFSNLTSAIPVVFAYGIAMAGAAAAAAMLWSRRGQNPLRAETGILAVVGYWGLIYTGLVLSVQARTANDPSSVVASVRAMIPPGESLVSFRPVHHLFAYYFRQPIQLRPLTGARAPRNFNGNYFCFAEDPEMPKLEIPFAWECIAEISCERGRSPNPVTKVIVGRRVSHTAVAMDDESTDDVDRPLTSLDAHDQWFEDLFY